MGFVWNGRGSQSPPVNWLISGSAYFYGTHQNMSQLLLLLILPLNTTPVHPYVRYLTENGPWLPQAREYLIFFSDFLEEK